MGRKLFRVDFDFWCKLEFCLEKGKNTRKLHFRGGGRLNKGHPMYELVLPGRNRAWFSDAVWDFIYPCLLLELNSNTRTKDDFLQILSYDRNEVNHKIAWELDGWLISTHSSFAC